MNNSIANKLIFILTTAVLVTIEFFALKMDSHFKYDFIFVMILLVGCYLLQHKIDLHPFHYFLLSTFLIFHMLGTFHFYSYYPLGIEYDYWMHSFFGFISALLLYRLLTLKKVFDGIYIIAAVITIILGLSAVHELYEYAGAILLGEGEGVLFIGAGDLDPWDTQNDMLNNLIGGIIGVTIYCLYPKKKVKE